MQLYRVITEWDEADGVMGRLCLTCAIVIIVTMYVFLCEHKT